MDGSISNWANVRTIVLVMKESIKMAAIWMSESLGFLPALAFGTEDKEGIGKYLFLGIFIASLIKVFVPASLIKPIAGSIFSYPLISFSNLPLLSPSLSLIPVSSTTVFQSRLISFPFFKKQNKHR